MSDDPQGLVTYSREAAALGLPGRGHGHHRRQLHDRRERHRRRARERGQRPPRLVAAPLPRDARRHGAHPRDDGRRRLHGRAAVARGRRAPAAELRLVAQRAGRRRRRRPRGVRRDRPRQRALAHPRERRERDPQLHPLRLVPDGLPGLLQGRRARLRLGLRRPDRRRADAAPDRHAAGRGPQAAVPVVALRRLHRHLPGRHPAARHAGARPRPGQPRRRRLARRARCLGRLGARLVEPAAVPRLGAGRRALGSAGPGLRARLELARRVAPRCRCPARSRSTSAGATWRANGDRDVHRRARGRRQRGRARRRRRGGARARRRPAGQRHDALLLERRSAGDVDRPRDARTRGSGRRCGRGHHGRRLRRRRDGHARADLRRGPLARNGTPARPAHRAAGGRSAAADARRRDRAGLRRRGAARR